MVGDCPDTLTYESPIFTVDQNSMARQEFDLAPDVVCGRYVRLKLIGKPNFQKFGNKADNGYYVAINNFAVSGVCLDQFKMPAAVEEKKSQEK